MSGPAGDDGRDSQASLTERRDLPIVVGGCHRSGTTLMRRILDSHSRISCGPELKFLIDFHDGYTRPDELRHERFTTTARDHIPEAEAFTVLGAAFLELHRRRARRLEKPRWADKNPENLLYLDSWTHLLGRDWLLVHVVRDVRDVLASMEEAEFPYAGANRVEDRITHYVRYMEAAGEFEQRWPERYLAVSYERLVAAPATEIKKVMRWLGEKAEDAQLALSSSATDGLGDPKVARRSAISRESIGRWHEDLDSRQVEAAQRALRSIRTAQAPR